MMQKCLVIPLYFSDTVGCASNEEVALWAEMAFDRKITPALHLHHKGNEEKALTLVKTGTIKRNKRV